jgi:hypothetical protein
MAIQPLCELPRYNPYVHVRLLQKKLPGTRLEQCSPYGSGPDQGFSRPLNSQRILNNDTCYHFKNQILEINISKMHGRR